MASVNKRANRRAKDQENAARLKAEGVVRVHLRCPVCNRIVSLPRFPEHIRQRCEENP